MRRGLAIAITIGIAVMLALVWRARSDQATRASSQRSGPKHHNLRPQWTEPGAIAGIVSDDAKAPIAGAFVCVEGRSDDRDPELLRDLPCITTDARGAFTIPRLSPARYEVVASSAKFRPARSDEIVLTAAETMVVELALARGGVEITGTVADLTGGPIAKARVASNDAITETRDDGSFALWVTPGSRAVTATADGYAKAVEYVHAPGRVELFLIPEGTLSGTVVDAITNEPVEGARVVTQGSERDSKTVVMTDARGAFRAARLPAGRYTVAAYTEHGYGRSQGSVIVGIGAHVSGVVVQLHPAALVVGKVIVSTTKRPCEEPSVSLAEVAKARHLNMSRRSNGTIAAEGVLPGTYAVEVTCKGFLERDVYAPVIVSTSDVSVEWEVDPGATITGTIRTASGAPIANTYVSAIRQRTGDEKWRANHDTTDDDGDYEIAGLSAGTYEVKLRAASSDYPHAKASVTVVDGVTVEQDLVIPDQGTLRGSVVDGSGKPLGRVSIVIDRAEEQASMDVQRSTDANGSFVIDRVQPGDYYVTARRSWQYESKEVRSERVTVRANQTSAIAIVIKEDLGVISGVVIDSAGKPVADAFVTLIPDPSSPSALSEFLSRSRSSSVEQPIVSAVDGTFTATQLPLGTYTIRASRKGGASGFVEHVPIGGTAKIQIKQTGSIAGSVRSWNSTLDELSINASGTTVSRYEHFFRTNGAFSIDDLSAGHYTVTAGAEGKQASVEVDLGEGERKAGVVIELVSLVTITGRTIDHVTRKPVANVNMAVQTTGGRTGFSLPYDANDRSNITDDNGRFTIKRAPVGRLVFEARGPSYEHSFIVRTIAGTNLVDVGDIPVFQVTALSGESGIAFPDDAYSQLDRAQLVVKSVAANSPAAIAGIKAGDIVTEIDGIDVRGYGSLNSWFLLARAPGTKVSITLARGVTVVVVLGKGPAP